MVEQHYPYPIWSWHKAKAHRPVSKAQGLQVLGYMIFKKLIMCGVGSEDLQYILA